MMRYIEIHKYADIAIYENREKYTNTAKYVDTCKYNEISINITISSCLEFLLLTYIVARMFLDFDSKPS